MKEKFKYAKPVGELSGAEREREIYRLELERERICAEIASLVEEYSRAIGDGRAMRGAKRIGKMPNDWSYWHKKVR